MFFGVDNFIFRSFKKNSKYTDCTILYTFSLYDPLRNKQIYNHVAFSMSRRLNYCHLCRFLSFCFPIKFAFSFEFIPFKRSSRNIYKIHMNREQTYEKKIQIKPHYFKSLFFVKIVNFQRIFQFLRQNWEISAKLKNSNN